jgi:hypothetical protein
MNILDYSVIKILRRYSSDLSGAMILNPGLPRDLKIRKIILPHDGRRGIEIYLEEKDCGRDLSGRGGEGR